MREFIVPTEIPEEIEFYKEYKCEEIVRCKDCKWFHQAFKSEGRCIKHDNDYRDPDWFCADGEEEDAEM